jgi:ribosomal protein L14
MSKAKPKAKGKAPASKPRKSATKSKSSAKAGAKAQSGARKAKPVKLLSGGNPQIAKADGDAPVQAYIAAMPGWKRDLGKRLDALIVRNATNVRKAVKWNSPF